VLTARQRQVLLLYHEFGPVQAAREAGVGTACVLQYVAHAMKKIRRTLAGIPIRRQPDRWTPEEKQP
jgi:DNA-directed RNA polymerase specialized sigma24 family protein